LDDDDIEVILKWSGEQVHQKHNKKKSIAGEEREALGKELIINGISNTRNKLLLENGNSGNKKCEINVKCSKY
jgi:hypothetical protein